MKCVFPLNSPPVCVCESELHMKITLACPGVQSGYSVCTDRVFPAVRVCVWGGDPQ